MLFRSSFKNSIWVAVTIFVIVSLLSLYLISSTHLKEHNDAYQVNQQNSRDSHTSQQATHNHDHVNLHTDDNLHAHDHSHTQDQESIVAQKADTVDLQPDNKKEEDKKQEDTVVKIPNVVARDVPGEDPVVRERRNAIKNAFIHAYHGYEKKCMGNSELRPISGGCHDWMFPGLPLTAADSLDTMLIMGLEEEYLRAIDHFKKNLRWDKDLTVSVFETTIRFVGGFLTAYQMTGEPFLLNSVSELTNRLLPAFNTPTGLPRANVNLYSGASSEPHWMSDSSVLAEVGTLQLEFATLSHLTGNPIYLDKAVKVYEAMKKVLPSDYLFPTFINPNSGHFRSSTITLGGLGDSYYEYLLKFWLLNEKQNKEIGDWYRHSSESIISQLVRKAPIGEDRKFDSDDNFLHVVFERDAGGRLVHKMDHLACFTGGMLALGSLHIDDEETKKKHLEVGEGLGRFCWEMYNTTATGLSGEGYYVDYQENKPVHLSGGASQVWIMRPEAVETWFILWRITKKQKYRDWGWYAFESMLKYAKTEFGFSGIHNVNIPHPPLDDVQQSFFLAETLKYLYLLYTPDDIIPLDKFIFNTEAHPLLIFKN